MYQDKLKVVTNKFLPCTYNLYIFYRLVHGTAPRGLKSPSHFVPEIRLLSIFEEEHIFALPLQKETQSVAALPLAAPLKLLRTRNEDQLFAMPEFNRLVDKCTKLSADVADRIQVLDGKLGESKKQSSGQELKNGYVEYLNKNTGLILVVLSCLIVIKASAYLEETCLKEGFTKNRKYFL